MLNDLILLIYQLYVMPLPPPYSLEISALIKLCQFLEITPGAVRTAVSRMKSQGILSVKKEKKESFYTLSPKALIAREGFNKKVFVGEDIYLNWENDWWLVSCAFEKKNSGKRQKLANLLQEKGFGRLHRGLWLKPVDPYLWLEREIEKIGLKDEVTIFATKVSSPEKAVSMARQIWPMQEMAAEFNVLEGQLRERTIEYRNWDDQNCFVHQIDLFNQFAAPLVRFPIIPPSLLADDWPGLTYRELFNRTNERLMLRSRRFIQNAIRAT